MNIGLVDDDPAVRRGLTRLIRACGHRVLSYDSGGAFLQRPADEAFDCLLVDVRMPGITGLELFERIRSEGSNVPIIFITGHGDADLEKYALKRGSLAVLSKPIDEDALLAAIHDALHKSHPRPSIVSST
jgi:FixJ family two-component response regulator